MHMGAGSFSDIPSDIFSYITHFSSLTSITRLCQVCKRFSQFVLEDKRLWIENLRRDVISNGIELPRYRRDLGNANAEDVHFWVKTAISLRRSYASNGQNAKVYSFSVAEELETTWVKIVRGRWFLAAMSNVSQSFVGIWKIQPEWSLAHENKFYVPGPILDGVVDDDGEEVRIAFTVATTEPYIQILSLGVKCDRACLTPLRYLGGARHVFFLKNSIVGYGTMRGDDTLPLLTDWRTGATIWLCPALYNNHPHTPLGDVHSVCHAMWIWRDHIFVVLNFSVEIFALPSLGTFLPNPAYHFGCQSLYFPMIEDNRDSGGIGEAYVNEFEQFPLEVMPNDTESSLRITIRDRFRDQVHCLTLIQSRGDPEFSWEVNPLFDKPVSSRTFKLCVGISNEYMLHLSGTGRVRYLAVLDIVRRARFPYKDNDAQSEVRQHSVLATPGLPILDTTTTMDFDDAAGVILLGGCRGKLCVIQFVDAFSRGLGCFLDDLPPVHHDMVSLPTSPVPMNLPYCYYRPDVNHVKTVPPIVLEEVLRGWDKAYTFPKVVPPPGWSSDWRRNSKIRHWVLPFPRWRALSVDQEFHIYETSNRIVRAKIGSHGDIVPIMYSENKHDFVIFKIGQRIYSFNKPDAEDDEPRIWTLSYSEQDLSNPVILAEVYENGWYRGGPLSIRSYDFAGAQLLEINDEYLKLEDFLKTDDGRMELAKRSLGEDPRTWPPDDRGEIQGFVNWKWRLVHQQVID